MTVRDRDVGISRGSCAILHRRRRFGAVLLFTLSALVTAALILCGYTLIAHLTSPAHRVPPLSDVLTMSDEEAAAALSGYTETHIRKAWGEAWSESDYSRGYTDGTPTYCLLYKEADGLDHVELYFSRETGRLIGAEVWQVFKAYPVHSASDLSWGIVTPLAGEEEAALGEQVEINYRSSRPAVIDYLDSLIPVIIYYKGEPKTADENHPLPYIDTVREMHFYDNILEPNELDE